MRPHPSILRPTRAFAALALLASLLLGEVADARHHLSEQGCAADTGGRDDNCTCANLHASSLACDGPAEQAPVELPREFTPLTAVSAPAAPAPRGAAARAPPRG